VRNHRLPIVWITGFVLATSAAWGQNSGANNKSEVRLIDSIQGPDLFRAYCASCHGADAKGHGPVAPALRAAPADLTRIAIRNHGVFPMERIQKVILGEGTTGGHGSREMPVWGPIFSQVTRDVDLGRVRVDNLARYLRDIQVVK